MFNECAFFNHACKIFNRTRNGAPAQVCKRLDPRLNFKKLLRAFAHTSLPLIFTTGEKSPKFAAIFDPVAFDEMKQHI